MKRLTIKIHGDVQGVYFRESAVETAKELGLVGWVRNDKDGCVSVVVEGEEGKLLELLNYCNEGPKMSVVDSVEEKWDFVKSLSFNNFEIKY
jgi:acylphosphatase